MYAHPAQAKYDTLLCYYYYYYYYYYYMLPLLLLLLLLLHTVIYCYYTGLSILIFIMMMLYYIYILLYYYYILSIYLINSSKASKHMLSPIIGRDKFLAEFLPVQGINPFLVYVTNCHIVQAFLLHAVAKPSL